MAGASCSRKLEISLLNRLQTPFFNHFGADVEPNVAASHVKNSSKVRAKRTQGILARPREANVGAGNSLAKS